MFFLTNMYERRLNENMQRHRMDAKIAPSRPKPACRVVQSETVTEKKHEIVNRFLVAQKEKPVVTINHVPASPPPTYQDSLFGSKTQLSSNDSQLSLFEIKAPTFMENTFKVKRSGSLESGFYNGDSDAASNVSVSA